MERRTFFRHLLLSTAAAVLALSKKAAAAATGSVTNGGLATASSRKFTVVGPSNNVQAVYLVTVTSPGHIFTQLANGACKSTIDVLIRESDFQTRTNVLVVVDCSGGVAQWKSPPGGPFTFVGSA